MEKNTNEEIKYFDLTNPQKSIWLTEQFYSGSSINNLGGHITIHEKVNFNILTKAINNFVKNNDSFLIRLIQFNNKIKEYFSNFSEFKPEILDFNDEKDISEFENIFFTQPINLLDSPLF